MFWTKILNADKRRRKRDCFCFLLHDGSAISDQCSDNIQLSLAEMIVKLKQLHVGSPRFRVIAQRVLCYRWFRCKERLVGGNTPSHWRNRTSYRFSENGNKICAHRSSLLPLERSYSRINRNWWPLEINIQEISGWRKHKHCNKNAFDLGLGLFE